MTGIVTALTSDDDISIDGQEVGNLTLTLVTPLGTKHNYVVRHVKNSQTQTVKKKDLGREKLTSSTQRKLEVTCTQTRCRLFCTNNKNYRLRRDKAR